MRLSDVPLEELYSECLRLYKAGEVDGTVALSYFIWPDDVPILNDEVVRAAVASVEIDEDARPKTMADGEPRWRRQKGDTCKYGHPWSRYEGRDAAGYRICKECRRLHGLRRYRRLAAQGWTKQNGKFGPPKEVAA